MSLIYVLLAMAKLVSAGPLFANSTISSASAAATSLSTYDAGVMTAASSAGSCDTCSIEGGDVQVCRY